MKFTAAIDEYRLTRRSVMTDGRTSRAISEAFVDAALDIRCRACDGKGRVPAFWYGRWRECMACGGTGTSRAGQAARVLAEADTLRRELDKARAEADVLVQQVGVEGAMRAAAEAQAARYQEALERIAAFHHAPGKTYKAAWVESVRMAREVLGMAQGAASSPDPMRDEPDSERDDAREEAREWARQFNRRRAREAVEAALPAGPVTADTEFVWIGGVPFVNATKHEAVVALRCAERDEARAEATRLRERELDDFTVTGDELDAALDRAEKAEQERDRYREALERIAEGESEHEWFFREDLRDVARAALGGGDD